jgi:hypothetical protein
MSNERSKDSMQQTEERTYSIYPFNNPKNNEKFHLAIIFSKKIYFSLIYLYVNCQFDPLWVEYFDQLTSKQFQVKIYQFDYLFSWVFLVFFSFQTIHK